MDKKRIANAAVAAGLSLSMVLTSVPATALAEGANDAAAAQEQGAQARTWGHFWVKFVDENGTQVDDGKGHAYPGATFGNALAAPEGYEFVSAVAQGGFLDVIKEPVTADSKVEWWVDGVVVTVKKIETPAPVETATVTFYNSDDSVLDKVTYEKGKDSFNSDGRADKMSEKLTVPENKEFVGWKLMGSDDLVADDAVVTGDWHVYPVFKDVESKPVVYGVNVFLDGTNQHLGYDSVEAGTNLADVLNAGDADSKYELDLAPTRDGKKLVAVYNPATSEQITYDAEKNAFTGYLMVNSDVEVYAVYKADEPTPEPDAKHVVTLMYAGTSTPIDSNSLEEGQNVADVLNEGGKFNLPAQDKDGNPLESLSTDSEGKNVVITYQDGKFAGDITVPNKDLVLYVSYEQPVQTAEVTFYDSDDSVLGTGIYAKGDGLNQYGRADYWAKKLTVPEGKAFVGWAFSETPDDVLAGDYAVMGNIHVYPVFADAEQPVQTAEVTFYDSDDSVLGTGIYAKGDGLNQYGRADYWAKKLTVPEGKAFVGWAFSETPDDVLAGDYAVMGNIHVYPVFADAEQPAQWAKATFLDEDGKTVIGTADYEIAKALNFWAVTPAARDGYTFKGYKIQGKDGVVDPAQVTMSRDGMTFVAVWEKNATPDPEPVTNVKVTFIATTPDTDDIKFDKAFDVKPGEAPEVPAELADLFDGYTLTGFMDKAGKTYDAKLTGYAAPQENDILYAQYKQAETPVDPVTKTHKVTFDFGTGETKVVEVKDGETVARPTEDPTYDGYTFLSWYADKDLNEEYDFSKAVTEDITIYAGWSKNADTTNPGDDNANKPGEETTTPDKDNQATDDTKAPVADAKKDAVPDTGDTTNTAAVAGVGVAGVLAAVAGYFFKRRTNE